MVDHLAFHVAWPGACDLLLDSQLPRRLESLELVHAPSHQRSILLEEDCLARCFPPAAPFPFLALAHLALPVSVSESAQVLFPLAQLRHLPQLRSLLISLQVVAESELTRRLGVSQSVLAQLSAVSTVRWLAVMDVNYSRTERHQHAVTRTMRLALIAALFGDRTSTAALRIVFLTVQLPLINADEIEIAMAGITRHTHPMKGRMIHLIFQERKDLPASAANRITLQHLRHLRPTSQRDNTTVVAGPLSADCAAAIDQYRDSNNVIRATKECLSLSTLRPHNAISRALEYADSAHPRWAQIVPTLTDCRLIRSSCLLSITRPLRTRSKRSNLDDGESVTVKKIKRL